MTSCIVYKPKTFTAPTLAVIDTANDIIAEYADQGYDLTLRQLYYQFVARDFLPNTDRSYKRLGAIISDARLAGLLDWRAITDRTRNLRQLPHWTDAREIIRASAQGFQLDRWLNQPYRVEVWVEKDALAGVVESVCEPLDVPFFSCRGYTSQSEMWEASQRLGGYLDDGQIPVILHLGDHDPSGMDMSRDIQDRLTMFLDGDGYDDELVFARLALNYDQVAAYRPPPNPAKTTDSRYRGYIGDYGRESWELDALDPATLGGIITTAIDEYRDEDRWDARIEHEESIRGVLADAVNSWDTIEQLLQTGGLNDD